MNNSQCQSLYSCTGCPSKLPGWTWSSSRLLCDRLGQKTEGYGLCTCVDRISQDHVLDLLMNCSLPGIGVFLLTVGARRLTGRGRAPVRNESVRVCIGPLQ